MLRLFVMVLIGITGITLLSAGKLHEANKPKPVPQEVKDIFFKYGCSSCHKPTHRHVGPSFYHIAQKKYEAPQMLELIRKPKPENWPGFAAMTPMPDVTLDEVMILKKWMDTLEPAE